MTKLKLPARTDVCLMLWRAQEKRRKHKVFIAIVSVIQALSGIAVIGILIFIALLIHH